MTAKIRILYPPAVEIFPFKQKGQDPLGKYYTLKQRGQQGQK